MQTMRTPDELNNQDYNYYLAFSILPTQKDPKKIETAMAQLKNNFTQGTVIQRRLIELYAEAVTIMTDAALRGEEFQAAKKLKLEAAERTIAEIAETEGSIYKSVLKKVADKSDKWFTVDEIEKQIESLLQHGAQLIDDTKRGTKRNLDFLTYKKIEKLLETIDAQKTDLYDWLGKTQNVSLGVLIDAVTDAYNKAGGKTDHKSTAINQISGEAKKIFKDENSKKYYDTYLATKDIWDAFDDKRNHGLPEITQKAFSAYCEKAKTALKTNDTDWVEELLQEGLQHFVLKVVVGKADGYSPMPSPKPAPAPPPPTKPTPAPTPKPSLQAWAKKNRPFVFGAAALLVAVIVGVAIFSSENVAKKREARYLEALALYDNKQYDQAVPLLQALANEGYAKGQDLLGNCYYNGEGVEKDYAQAIVWYRKAANQGYVNAQTSLGSRYYYGEGVEKDYAQAVEWLRKAANQGDAHGQVNLGNRYYYGEGVEKDYVQAVEWYRKAADQGDAQGQVNLGNGYYYGEGVEKDYVQAVEWYRKAADQGDAPAQFRLGGCYYYGDGVSKDFAQAVAWYRKAADQGYARAQWSLGLHYQNGNGVEKDYAQAVEWFRKAADQGYASAQWSLGLRYHDGEGVEKDYAQAVEWFRKATDQGHAAAQVTLGQCYYLGQGVAKDYAQAVEWWRKAADQGNAAAQHNLGICFENGEGVTKDYAQAAEWYRKAADQGFENAKKALDRLKKEGKI